MRGTLAWYAYEYDHVGNRLKVTDQVNGDVTTFAYDAAHRLINERASGSLVYNTTHTYDPVGNRLFEDAGVQRSTFTYDVANQLKNAVLPTGSPATHTYTYDRAGNMTNDFDTALNEKRYSWNAENQLKHIDSNNETDFDFEYDGDGLRSLIAFQSVNVQQLWDDQNLLRESGGGTTTVYTYAPQLYGELISRRVGTTSAWYLYDALGSAVKRASSTGSVSGSKRYGAYGKVLSGAMESGFGWVGRYGYYGNSNYSLYYVRARYYDIASARWMSRDPLGYEASQWNLYKYVRQNPSSLGDPSGLYAMCSPGHPCPPTFPMPGIWPGPAAAWDFPPCVIDCLIGFLGLPTGAQLVSWGWGTVKKERSGLGGRLGKEVSEKVSEASIFFRDKCGDLRFPWNKAWPAPTWRNWQGVTTRVGRFLGRWTPILGWGLLALSGYQMYKCLRDCSFTPSPLPPSLPPLPPIELPPYCPDEIERCMSLDDEEAYWCILTSPHPECFGFGA